MPPSKALAALCAVTGSLAVVPAASAQSAPGDAIPGAYIVTFKNTTADEVGNVARRIEQQRGADVLQLFTSALRGTALRGLSQDDRSVLLRDPRVAAIEPDRVVSIDATQAGAPQGLDRIDQSALPLDGSYTYGRTGAGVAAYVIDTGIRASHRDFGGRAAAAYDALGGNGSDCQGHGTHVAGTVGGTTYGVAKAVAVKGVRVLNCQGSGSTSDVIEGVDWVTRNAVRPAVANMSLGGGSRSQALENAVRASISSGIPYAVAAGNETTDACGGSPSALPEAVTVAASDVSDRRASFSNFGSCVDLFAPGVRTLSAGHTSDTGTATLSGTSMASPHVAGGLALAFEANPGATAAQVSSALLGAATRGRITDERGTPDVLLNTSAFGGGQPPVEPPAANRAPIAASSSACEALRCTFTDASTDADGTVVSRSWSFGDGATSTQPNPSHTYAAAGTYPVALTVTDDDGATATTTASVTVTAAPPVVTDPDPSTPTLRSGVITSASTAAGGWTYFKIVVPAGRPSLRVELDGPACGLFGCSTDLDLYVRRAVKPTASATTCRAIGRSSDETCSITAPAADVYYVGVQTFAGRAGTPFRILATA